MTDSDEALREALRKAEAGAAAGRVPDFDSTWAAARVRAGKVRSTKSVLAGAAIAATVAAIAFGLLRPSEDEWHYIDANDLLETTRWSAPSDSLLPVHQFDIYQDIPVLIESTESNGGTLL